MSIRSLLELENMMEMYQGDNYAFSLETPFTDNFGGGQVEEETDDFVYLGDPAENRPTPLNVRGGEANILDQAGAFERRGVLFHLFNGITFGKELEEAWSNPGDRTRDKKGAREVGRQMAHFKRRQIITKELVYSRIMTQGKVIFDPRSLKIKDTADSDDVTVTLGVSDTHQGDCGGLRQGQLSDNDWDIQAFFDRIDQNQRKTNKPKIKHVWVNTENRHYLLANTAYQLWAAKNGRDSEQALRGEVVENVFGKTWHFVEGGCENAAGTENESYLPEDLMLLTADLNTGWYKASKGLVRVPTMNNIVSDPEAALASMSEVYGEHAFAVLEIKGGRVRINGYAGDCFGLNLIEPDALYQVTVIGDESSSSG